MCIRKSLPRRAPPWGVASLRCPGLFSLPTRNENSVLPVQRAPGPNRAANVTDAGPLPQHCSVIPDSVHGSGLSLLTDSQTTERSDRPPQHPHCQFYCSRADRSSHIASSYFKSMAQCAGAGVKKGPLGGTQPLFFFQINIFGG